MVFIGVSFHTSSSDTALALSHQSRCRWQLAFFFFFFLSEIHRYGNSFGLIYLPTAVKHCNLERRSESFIMFRFEAVVCRRGLAGEHEVGLDERVLYVCWCLNISTDRLEISETYSDKDVIYNSPLFQRAFPNSPFFLSLLFKCLCLSFW